MNVEHFKGLVEKADAIARSEHELNHKLHNRQNGFMKFGTLTCNDCCGIFLSELQCSLEKQGALL